LGNRDGIVRLWTDNLQPAVRHGVVRLPEDMSDDLLARFGEYQDRERLRELLALMGTDRIEGRVPTLKTFHTLLRYYSLEGDASRAEKVRQMMERQKVEPTSTTFTILADLHGAQGNPAGAWEALVMADKHRDQACCPTATLAYIRACANEPDAAHDATLTALQKVAQHGILPTPSAVAYTVKTLMLRGAPELTTKALELLEVEKLTDPTNKRILGEMMAVLEAFAVCGREDMVKEFWDTTGCESCLKPVKLENAKLLSRGVCGDVQGMHSTLRWMRTHLVPPSRQTVDAYFFSWRCPTLPRPTYQEVPILRKSLFLLCMGIIRTLDHYESKSDLLAVFAYLENLGLDRHFLSHKLVRVITRSLEGDSATLTEISRYLLRGHIAVKEGILKNMVPALLSEGHVDDAVESLRLVKNPTVDSEAVAAQILAYQEQNKLTDSALSLLQLLPPKAFGENRPVRQALDSSPWFNSAAFAPYLKTMRRR